MDTFVVAAAFTSFGRGFPWGGTIVGAIFVLWQLLTGTMFTQSFKPWISRSEQPRKYWIAFAIEASIVIAFTALGFMTRTP
jgi:hypothetical protein